jgi:hypothetical protein
MSLSRKYEMFSLLIERDLQREEKSPEGLKVWWEEELSHKHIWKF